MAFNGWFGQLSREVGIDLGTANSLVFVRGKGIVVREPSVVAQRGDGGEILAVGDEAKKMIGRTPADIVATRPLRHGVIADFRTTALMLSYFIQRGLGGRRSPRRVMVGIPGGATEVEKRAVMNAALQIGAKDAHLIEQPLAAALGVGLPISEPVGNMIVDIGGGMTQVAVMSLGGTVVTRSIRVGGDEMNDSIIQYARKMYNLLIGEQTAEDIKIQIGSAYPQKEELTMDMRGRDLLSGLPRIVRVTSSQMREAMAEPIAAIIETVKTTLELTPPELAADVLDRGILMTGGGSLLRGIDRLLSEEIGIPVVLTDDPLSSVALGTGKALEELETLKRVLITSRRM
jgi:rod shape-determining protein MreB and related proteins